MSKESILIRKQKAKKCRFVFTMNQIPMLIALLTDNFQVCESAGHKITTLTNCYFDTPKLEKFHEQINGKLARITIRHRSTLETEKEFLEIKIKTNHGEITRIRKRISMKAENFDSVAEAFVQKNAGTSFFLISKSLTCTFKRIVLKSHDNQSRITLDFDLTYDKPLTNSTLPLNNLVIAKITGTHDICKTTGKKIHQLNLKKEGISKYCLGVAITNSPAKINGYKLKIRTLEKLAQKWK